MTQPPRPREVGQSRPRIDGRDKVTGAARYVDDLNVPGMWHGATVRSPHPAARIDSIDFSRARQADPEVAAITAADLPGPNVVKLIAEDWPILAAEEVHHVGEAVAIVVAPTRERARAAADRVDVTYTEVPGALTLDDALRGDPRVGGQVNVLASSNIDWGDVDQGLADADHIVEGEYETGWQEHIYIEPQGMIAIPQDDGSVEIVGSMQCPYYVQHALAHALSLEPDMVRVRHVATGGGFGGKEDFPDMLGAHAALLARKIKRPVKIVYDRHEDIVATTKRHPSRVRIRTGVAADGRLLAQDIEVVLDGGAYITLSPVVLSRAVIHAAGPYACPNVRIQGRVLATNTVPNGAFRGFGAPQSQFAAERQMDRIGRRLGIDPYTIRERNAYRVGDTTPTGQVLKESVSAIECLQEAETRTRFRERWQQFENARANAPDDGRPVRGLGLSLVWHGSGFTGNGEQRMNSPVTIRLNEAGAVEVRVAATEFGQGTTMVLQQMVADAVGVTAADIVVVNPDTVEVPDSGPTVASRTVMVVGGILVRAGKGLADQLMQFAKSDAASPIDCGPETNELELKAGQLLDESGAVLGSFSDIAAAYVASYGTLDITERFEAMPGIEFDEETYRGAAYSAYGWACDIIELEVDPDTLAVSLTDATLVYDVGKAIHPAMCRGQVEGGTLQALGYGFMEEIKLKDGAYMNDRLATYIIPTIRDTPDMDTVLIENPTPSGAFGAKGVGEIPMDGGAPAVLSAIENATGIVAAGIPATPERLFSDRMAGRVVSNDRAGSAKPAEGGPA